MCMAFLKIFFPIFNPATQCLLIFNIYQVYVVSSVLVCAVRVLDDFSVTYMRTENFLHITIAFLFSL